MKTTAILISGLPASGKTTFGKVIAERCCIPFLDKDDYLEQLFEQNGDGVSRQILSRESDELFRKQAISESKVVLVSHWKPPGSSSSSGTPSEWVFNSFDQIIEVYCQCPIEIAAQRFLARQRHPDHQDHEKNNHDNVLSWLVGFDNWYPLAPNGIKAFAIRLEQTSDIDLSIKAISQFIDKHNHEGAT